MSNRKVRVGVAGVGRMGAYHLGKFKQIPEADLIGFYEADSRKSMGAVEKFGVPAFSSLEELLVEVDALSIATPTATHFATARRALEAGVHVLVEKPIASSVSEAEALVRIAAERNLILQVGMVERFRLESLSRGLLLRPVRFIETHRLALAPGRESGIDVVADLMIHDLDLVLSLVGEDPVYVSAVGIPVLTPQCDIANVRMEFPSGAVANLTASRISRAQLRKFRVFSTDAYISMDFVGNSAEICRRTPDNRIELKAQNVAQLDSLRDQCCEFIRCVSTNSSPTVRGEDGLRALRFAALVSKKIEERTKAPRNDAAGISQAAFFST